MKQRLGSLKKKLSKRKRRPDNKIRDERRDHNYTDEIQEIIRE
jgi:hypothetical protein